MRAAVLLVLALVACTPDIVSDSYLCGPNEACPDDQVCNGPDNHCVLPSGVQPFACTPKIATEPDNTAQEAHVLPDLGCVSVPFIDENCMLENDAEDWVKLAAPACAAVQIEAVVTFPVAFERIKLELWDLDHMTNLGEDVQCPQVGEEGEELRCLTKTLVSGTNYGIQVKPAGDGDCDGDCRFNRYTLRVQLSTP